MLGLALGDTIPTYKKRFPGAHIIAIEIDPVMVELMDQLTRPKPFYRPEVLVGDALSKVFDISGTFDLIIVDMFDGLRVATAAEHPEFWKQLHDLLTPRGYALFNTYTQPDAIRFAKPYFSEEKIARYQFNHVIILRRSEDGVVGAQQVNGYTRMWASPAFISREIGIRHNYTVVYAGPAVGSFPHFMPIPFEHYYGDVEPILNSRPSSRFILWHPTSRTDVPLGWRKAPIPLHRKLTGYHDLEKNNSYWKEWSSQAQRHRSTWLKQTEIIASRPTMEQFLDAYKHCSKERSLITIFNEAIRRHVEAHGPRVRFYGVSKQDGTLIAAIATLEVPEIRLEHHITSFMLPEARKTVACTGFLDEWFKDAKTRGTRFLEFDGFWTPGEPASWKGFSAFKAQYVTHYVRYPNSLWKWVRGTKDASD